ncbi:MAG: hypothetical protein A2X94_09525 [Bdellovibrionales bacterium GWB1_55_8]|nr:MAG: hypothetical protein A2X94_09525 [Bdellovibrionales bacterium GWB1_55_8]
MSEFERVARDNEVLSQFGSSGEKSLIPDHLRVLVWNVHKAVDQRFSHDLARLASRSDLMILQEAVLNPRDRDFLGISSEHEWHMASSFFFDGGIGTGVATGARAAPFSVGFVRSPMGELFVWTPKMTLISSYKLRGMIRRLLVVNVHAINFVDRISFFASMTKIERAIKDHDGPVILAGDFNTWSPSRLAFLGLMAFRNRLKSVSFKRDSRFLRLDHVLVRELGVEDAELMDEIESSDHKPISLVLSVKRRLTDPIPAH